VKPELFCIQKGRENKIMNAYKETKFVVFCPDTGMYCRAPNKDNELVKTHATFEHATKFDSCVEALQTVKHWTRGSSSDRTHPHFLGLTFEVRKVQIVSELTTAFTLSYSL
jgi:hypothetical protein